MSGVLKFVKEIKDETVFCDFHPKLKPSTGITDAYTPDAVIRQTKEHSFLFELKTSWDHDNINQIVKYAESPGTLQADGSVVRFGTHHCIVVAYQNPPDDKSLEELYARLSERGIKLPVVLFRYALEVGAEDNRMSFSRLAYARNGLCPSSSSLGKALNLARGMSNSSKTFRSERSGFHKANDNAIPSYSGVMWWMSYAPHYLTDDQQAEMAEKGRLSTPLIIPAKQTLTKFPS